MILVDTSVWVNHLRASDKALAAVLDAGMVLAHPFVIGELALGNLRQREIVLKALADLRKPMSRWTPRSSDCTVSRCNWDWRSRCLGPADHRAMAQT